MGKNNKKNNEVNKNKCLENNENAVVNNKIDRKYVGAPYNFVSFSDKVLEYKKNEITNHNAISDELYSGEINYKITARTPIIVDSGKRNQNRNLIGTFHKDVYGKYSIPGSTMRGLIKNNAQILGLSAMGDDIDNYMLMYRNVAAGADKDLYDEILGAGQETIVTEKDTFKISVLKKVKAGFIEKSNGKYIIREAFRDTQNVTDNVKKNYYVVSYKMIFENKKDFPFFTSNNTDISKLMYTMECEFCKNRDGDYVVRNRNMINTNEYKPFYEKVYYKLDEKRKKVIGLYNIDEVDNDKVELEEIEKSQLNKGYIISSGYMYKKKVIYVIPEDTEDTDIFNLSDERYKNDLKAYMIDLKKKEKKLRDDYEFYNLPKNGEKKPIFYIFQEEENRLYFGFTPYLRLFYKNDIKKGLFDEHKKEIIDYAKAIFGYSNKMGSYKSRVSFTDAKVIGCINYDEMRTYSKSIVLAEPKPTSYLDYLNQDYDNNNKTFTYNSENFTLRGVKQYWFREKNCLIECEGNNQNVRQWINPLPPETEFIGKVRFRNLSKKELGLLLWSIKLNGKEEMNIGKGKAYGYGRVNIDILNVKTQKMNVAYNVKNKDGKISDANIKNLFDIKEIYKYENKIDEFIEAFKKDVKIKLDIDIDELPHIKEFMIMKGAETLFDGEDENRYMRLGNRKNHIESEYQSRINPLPSVEKIYNEKVESKKGMAK